METSVPLDTLVKLKSILTNVNNEIKFGGIFPPYSSSDKEIIPIVKYWIPHVKILKPTWIQEKIENDLKRFLGKFVKYTI